jgi:putative ABC transport system permease protein
MRLYRALLRLFPASFRDEYGDEMTAIFRRRLRDAGRAGRLAIWSGAVFEIGIGAAAVHGEILRQDLRYATRTLRHSLAFTITAIAVTAIGIGANTAAFSVTDFVLLRPAPYPEPDRLVKLWQRTPAYSRLELSPENYRDWKRQSRSFELMGAFWGIAANFVVPGAEPERLSGAAVTADVFSTLRVSPLLGRTFTDAEDRENAPGTIVLSYGLWHSLFAGDPAALGKSVTLDDRSYMVIGVMPPAFAFPSVQTEFWTPMQFQTSNPGDKDRTNTYLQVIARLNPGVTVAASQAEMTAIAAHLAQEFPRENEQTTAAVLRLHDEVSRQSRQLLLALSGASLCVLLIVCANLANLLMTRALARRREIAVRTAIGAGRRRLVRQLVTESALLALCGGVCGVALGYALLPLLARLAPANLPVVGGPQIDVRVLAFAAALTCATGFAFGLIPAARVGRNADAAGLREGARSGSRRERARAILVMAEVAACIVLLTGAGLLVRALWRIQQVDPGFRTAGVLTLRTTLPWPKYAETERRAAFYRRVLSEVRGLPGVVDAGYISGLPMVVRGAIWSVGIEGEPGARLADHSVTLRYVTPGFFRTISVPLKKGRDVSDGDDGRAPFVAVVSESFARRHWSGEDPIGKRFNVAFFDRTIVGVVADIRTRGLESPSEPQVYIPYGQIRNGAMPTYAPKDLAIRTSGTMDPLVPAVREIVHRVDPGEPVSDVRTLSEIVGQETAPRAVQLRVLGAFAAIALLLAIVGIHGLLAFTVSQRTQEFGVRIALGAPVGELAAMVLRRGAMLAICGSVPGLLFAYFAGQALQSLLAGVPPGDPATLAAVATLTITMTIAGSLTPALRVMRLNAVDALRAE